MERITPLAKILAEANGIEWEKLSGTGDGGTIVEQDILQYLSRIMSGEEEPPSTPVDAPPPDWTGEDIPGGGMFNADMLKGAGVDADIAAFVEQTRPTTPNTPMTAAAPVTPATAAPQLPTSFTPAPLDADEFELDDTPATPAEPIPTPVPTPAPAPAAGLGSLLSRLYKSGAETPEPTAPEVSPTPAVTPEIPAPAAPAAATPAALATTAPEVRPAQVPPAAVPAAVTAPEAAPIPVAAPLVGPAPVLPTPTAPVASAVQAPAMARPDNAPQQAAWLGVYLRRDTDAQAATDLAGQLAEALEQDVPLALLVARAAQRHAGLLSLSSVALDSGEGARPVREGHLREVLSGLTGPHEGTPDLLVVDASAYGLDDLHYPQTLTLSVGRTQAGRVSLSLNGNAETAQAAQFLARVGEALEKPIVLVL